jgi:CHAT domain-containing protein
MLKIRSKLIHFLGVIVLSFLFTVSIIPAIALEYSNDSSEPWQTQYAASPQALIDQGRNLYNLGRFAEASTVWQQATQIYQSRADSLNQALCLNYLALAYQALGNWEQAEQAITQSLNLLAMDTGSAQRQLRVRSQALNTQGTLQLALGQTEAALETWENAERAYAQLQDTSGVLGSQINQAQALQSLGLYRRAELILQDAYEQLHTQPASPLKVAGLRSLGTVWQVVGNLSDSQTILQESLAIARGLNLPHEISATLFSLGNTVRLLGNIEAATELYQESAAIAPDLISQLEAQINQFSLLVELERWELAQGLLSSIEEKLTHLSPSRVAVNMRVNLATTLMQTWKHPSAPSLASPTSVASSLAVGVQQARALQDAKAESSALGLLGGVYEQTQRWSEAQNLTQQALALAQSSHANEIAYRWNWQMGRILEQQGDRAGAIAAYQAAVETLQALRSDLVAANSNVQLSFRQEIEPVYRELVSLLVEGENPSQTNLKQAREVIEALYVTELENFLRSACLNVVSREIDEVDPSAAVIYPIALKDGLSVILSLPGQDLSVHHIALSTQTIETGLRQLFASFNPIFPAQASQRASQQVYDWLIRPIEDTLAAHQVTTLVFVLDGKFRNLPMAALFDGQHYLVEKYDVAFAPGLKLLESKYLDKEKLPILIGGLTEARQGFAPLPGVAVESQEIALNLDSKVFLNQNFTKEELQAQIRGTQSSVVHLATHGQFSSKLNDTFILTWNDRLTVADLKSVLLVREETELNPIELLVLSACQTAEGDEQAALGLAGLAVRSGARSTLATLWAVNDASTADLMVEFYAALTQQGKSKAAALKQAQLQLLNSSEYAHPYYWAPFVLVGNWL